MVQDSKWINWNTLNIISWLTYNIWMSCFFFRGVEISTLTSYVYATGVVLPFEPITISFENVQYYVDTPKVFARSTELTFWSFRELDMIYVDQISSIHLPGIEKERFSREKNTASSRYYRCIQAWSSYSFDGSQWSRKNNVNGCSFGKKNYRTYGRRDKNWRVP